MLDGGTPSSLSKRPLRISLAKGAELTSGAYSGIGGAAMILLVKTLISRFGCTIVILTLNGAISYARLSQYPSIAHWLEQYTPNPGVPRCAVVPVSTIM